MSELKEGDIDRDNVLSMTQKVDTIAYLGVRFVDKYPFEGVRCQLGCIGCVIVGGCHTPKHLRSREKSSRLG